MQNNIIEITPQDYFPLLKEMPDVPKKLFLRGSLPKPSTVLLTVVGSRKYTFYGKQVCRGLIKGLSGYDVGIVSGLAIGIDGIAHMAAIEAGLYTLAIPGSGLSRDALYPASHIKLAENILQSGGGLVSEYESDFKATKWSFPQRNRIMAGISSATLIIEATNMSGTLITARLAADYNRDVLAVPGPITSASSDGTNWLIRDGATPITCSDDILEAISIKKSAINEDAITSKLTDLQISILKLVSDPKNIDEISFITGVPARDLNITLSELELLGLISQDGGLFFKT